MNSSESGNKKLEAIYESYKNRMYITACKILKDPYLAEDAVHNAFVSILKNIDKLNSVDSISTASYVIKAARNSAINMLKRAQKEIPTLYSEEDIRNEESILDEICSEENYEIIVSAILSLDEKYRDVLSLYYLNGFTVREIGETLSRKENTVKGQLVRGRRKLIALIQEEVKENEKEYNTSAGF